MSHSPSHAQTPREPRQKVQIPVRIRIDNAWADMCLLDVSSRGLMIQGRIAPPRGAYVEVRRGRHVIVARVIWSKKHRFGVRTQDLVAAGVIAGERDTDPAGDAGQPTSQPAERRVHAREVASAEAHQRSRMMGRSIEFGFVLVAGSTLAMLCVSLASEAMLKPLSVVTAALN